MASTPSSPATGTRPRAASLPCPSPTPKTPVSKRRGHVVKLRLTDAERAELERLRQASRSESCAAYIRRKALAPEIVTTEIADLIGRVGLCLNTLDTATPRQLGRLSADLQDLAAELRRHRAG